MPSPGSPSFRSRLRFPVWQRVYDATLQETDRSKLFTLVEITEATLLTRRDVLKNIRRDRSERLAIERALEEVSIIKKERLGFDVEDRGTTKLFRSPRIGSHREPVH